jgi:hypothetical protein
MIAPGFHEEISELQARASPRNYILQSYLEIRESASLVATNIQERFGHDACLLMKVVSYLLLDVLHTIDDLVLILQLGSTSRRKVRWNANVLV